MNYKQLIIARKDLGMSAGKLAVQVSHASMAFLTNQIREKAILVPAQHYYKFPVAFAGQRPALEPQMEAALQEAREKDLPCIYYKLIGTFAPGETRPYHVETIIVTQEEYESMQKYRSDLMFDKELYENWIDGSFTKILCEAKNKNKLMAATRYGEELGLVEGKDFFLIRDNCLTELTPEDADGRTLTCIGFRPLPADICEKISKKYQLWRES